MSAQLQWFPGHMAKAKRQIEEKLAIVDIVIELCDARIPYSSQNPLITNITKNKPRVMLITKIDMADDNITKLWKTYYEKLGYLVFATNLTTFSKNDFKKIKDLAEDSMKEKRARDARKGIRPRAIRAMIVGIPNVGKSTLINKLSGSNKAIVGNKPGVTKAQQWIKVDTNFELLDTPGILQPKFEDHNIALNLALTNSIKQDILPVHSLLYGAVRFLYTSYNELFKKTYGDYEIDLESESDIEIKVNMIAQTKGLDYDKMVEKILYDLREGKLGKLSFEKP